MLNVFFGFALLASAISANKLILESLPAILFVGLRMFIAGSVLVAFNWKHNVRLRWPHLKQDMPIILAISLLTTFVPSMLKAYALQNLVSSKAAFFGSLDPFVTALYSYLIWHEKLSVQKIIGIIIGFIGTMILLVSRAPAEVTLRAFGFLSYPEIAAILAMAIGRLGWMMVQMLLKRERYKPTEINGVTMMLSGFFALMTAWLFEPAQPICVSYKVFALMTYSIIVGNLIGYTLYATFLKKYTATFVSLAGFSVPIFVYIYGWAILSEPLSTAFVVSMLVTFTGLMIFYQAELGKAMIKK